MSLKGLPNLIVTDEFLYSQYRNKVQKYCLWKKYKKFFFGFFFFSISCQIVCTRIAIAILFIRFEKKRPLIEIELNTYLWPFALPFRQMRLFQSALWNPFHRVWSLSREKPSFKNFLRRCRKRRRKINEWMNEWMNNWKNELMSVLFSDRTPVWWRGRDWVSQFREWRKCLWLVIDDKHSRYSK